MDGRDPSNPRGPSPDAALAVGLGAPAIGGWSYRTARDAMSADDAGRALFGAPGGSLGLERFLARVPDEDRARLAALVRGGAAGDAIEHRVVSPDGGERWAISRLADDGADDGVRRGCTVDTTAQRGLADRLIQLQRLAAIGQLAGGVAHTFNNLLAAMLPNLEVAQRHASGGAVEPLRQAREAALRATRLVKQLLALAGRHGDDDPVELDLAALCRRLADTCRLMFDPRITIEVEAPEALRVRGDLAQLEQAVLTLLLNARDAVAEREVHGGEHAPAIRLSLDAEAPRGAEPPIARVTVIDNGVGLPSRVRAHLAEPFFTTKPGGAGTGLGLAAALAIARGHGGELVADALPDGARFVFTLPALAGLPVAAAAAPTRRAPSARPVALATVLLAEDEPLVRRVLADMLRDAGYRVLEAIDGLAALEIYKEHDGQIDLCVIDQAMPRMSGQALLGILLDLDPCLKAISITGFGIGLKGARAVLDKPIAADHFLRTVADVLAEDDEPAAAASGEPRRARGADGGDGPSVRDPMA